MGAEKAVGRMWPSYDNRPFVVQIFGRDPVSLARAAEMAAEAGASIVDINMGCPAKKVTSGLCGSALMREPELAASLVKAVRRALPAHLPVTVKHRLGWDDDSVNAPEFALRMVDAGAALITVHGRTRSQGFSGQARLEPIAEVRHRLPREIPLLGNGDVQTVEDYVRMKHVTRCDGVMIGRGARGNPWLFRSLQALERGMPDPGTPTLDERRTVWRRHAGLVREHSSPRMVLHELRKTLAWYSRGLHNGSHLRQEAFRMTSPEALTELGESFFERLLPLGDDVVAPSEDPVAKSLARHGRRQSAVGAQAPADALPVS
ncbi:MAG: tRNA-dihydrouridine synthase [Myxococcales bacterium]|nr:tRNA-dihydrouridine synthase [Myxococcales bacterium]